MKVNEERVASIVLLLFSSAYLVGAFLIPMPIFKQQMGPDGFPKAIGIAMMVLAGIYVYQQFRSNVKKKKKKVNEEAVEKRAAIIGAEEKIEGRADLKTMGFMLILMLVYAFVFEHLGYAITTFLMFMAGVLYLDRRHLVRDGIIAVIFSFALYYIFSVHLRVQLPAGPLRILGL